MSGIVAFVLFGTRGDVEPGLHLANETAASQLSHTFVLVTHEAYRGWVSRLARSNIKVHYVAASPALEWNGHTANTVVAQRQLEDDLLGIFGGFHASCVVVAFNLFALEAWHIAEARCYRTIALAPYPMPHHAPSALWSWLAEETGSSVAFGCSGACLPKEMIDVAPVASESSSCWCELTHWMYPLLNEARWGPLRETLGLPPLAMSTPELRARPSARTALLYGFSELVLPPSSAKEGGADTWLPLERFCSDARERIQITGYWRDNSAGGTTVASTLAPSTAPVVAPLASVGRKQRTPLLAVTFGSMVSIGAIRGTTELAGVLSTIAKALAAADALGIVIVPSGIPDDVTSVRVAGADLRVHRCTSAEPLPWEGGGGLEAWAELSTWLDSHERAALLASVDRSTRSPPARPASRLFLHAGPVPSDWLFPLTDAVLHHGGSGTTSAALHAGVPQLVTPLIFDQHTWAQAVSDLGVAHEPLPFFWMFGDPDADAEDDNATSIPAREQLPLDGQPGAAGALSVAVRRLLDDAQIRQRVAQVAAKLRDEDGTAVAARRILKELSHGTNAALG